MDYYGYHITDRSHLNRIRKGGLTPSMENATRAIQMVNYVFDRVGKQLGAGQRSDHVFFFTTKEAANASKGPEQKCLEVQLTGNETVRHQAWVNLGIHKAKVLMGIGVPDVNALKRYYEQLDLHGFIAIAEAYWTTGMKLKDYSERELERKSKAAIEILGRPNRPVHHYHEILADKIHPDRILNLDK